MWTRRRSELALALALTLLAAPDARADDLDSLRSRFRAGMEKYRAGGYGEAVTIWGEVYAELGEVQGYRLAYNLARALDLSGDTTRAVEHYQSFVDQVAKRRERGEELEANVVTQEAETAERLRELRATKGRIHVASGPRAAFAKVATAGWRPAGFVAYVPPGSHTVVFRVDGHEERRRVDVAAGESIEVHPPAIPPLDLAVGAERAAPRPSPVFVAQPDVTTEIRVERPYPSAVLFASAGITLASIVVPAVMYQSALSIRDDYNAAPDAASQRRLASDYDTARANAYGSIALPASLGAITLGLVTYYFFATKETRFVQRRR